jgi:transcriptional regulator with XRE-family HTH domain
MRVKGDCGVMKTLGEIIREERLQREMTMKQFAGLLGVTPVYISA